MNQPGIEQVNPPVDHETSETPIAVELRKEVKAKVEQAHQNNEIRERVVNHLTEVELERRATLLQSALDKRDEVYKELNKVRPDLVQYTEGGQVVNEFFSKEQSKKRKDATEKLNKIDRAIDKAVNDADYDGLKQALDKLSKGGSDN